MLNNQFTSVFTKDQAETLPDLGNSTYPPMPKITVDETGVCSLLARLDPKKASGADNIPAIILKNCAEEITPMLSTIIQKSYDTHVVPSDWRKAAVSLVFKKGNRSKPENYRPTSICCKISEHIVVSNIMKHLDQHNILVDAQHSFRKKRSTDTQLLLPTTWHLSWSTTPKQM